MVRNTFWSISGLHSYWSFIHSPFLLVHSYWSIVIPYIYIDLFIFLPKDGIANYADDNTPYSTGNGIHNIVSDLEQASDILSKWFIDNYLKANPDKYHVLLTETSDTQLIVENVPIASSCWEKLLRIKIDQKMNHMLSRFVKKPIKNLLKLLLKLPLRKLEP